MNTLKDDQMLTNDQLVTITAALENEILATKDWGYRNPDVEEYLSNLDEAYAAVLAARDATI
jgi:hypothetical protein